MNKSFEVLLGNRVYLKVPPKKQTSIVLSEAAKKEIESEEIKKYSRLEVYAVGNIVTNVKEGDIVFVNPEALNNAPIIPLDEGEMFMVSPFDIIHIWKLSE